ncbi:hypothetical protein AQUSIP_15750 [Aquicella siphonis]|uniref:Uncharacterized protein n=1 Tax=Aquicella siphonis TaxID=254247 RepID=A0A5E4PIY8_9COXI|nr:hypothetical protein [Aquicella siphonis]VVC76266.1 hypothetical protein AQUSIP_15750 [Aquicella siphonis]
MENQVSWQLLSNLRNRLGAKGYIEVRPPSTYEIAMMKQTFGGTIPKVIAVFDATMTTDSPADIFNRHKSWFEKLLGNTGAGVLLYMYHQPSASQVDEILQLGRGMLGYGQVVAGVYDVYSNKYWMSDHMGWPDEIFK